MNGIVILSLSRVLALSLVLSALGAATALADCSEMSQRYAVAVSGIGTQTRRYADCVVESAIITACDLEYSRIQSAKDVLEGVRNKLRSEYPWGELEQTGKRNAPAQGASRTLSQGVCGASEVLQGLSGMDAPGPSVLPLAGKPS